MKTSTGRQTQILWFDDVPEFRDFNFSDSLIDPTSTQQKLAEWICMGREGHSIAADAFADAMYLTLRTAAFEHISEHTLGRQSPILNTSTQNCASS